MGELMSQLNFGSKIEVPTVISKKDEILDEPIPIPFPVETVDLIFKIVCDATEIEKEDSLLQPTVESECDEIIEMFAQVVRETEARLKHEVCKQFPVDHAFLTITKPLPMPAQFIADMIDGTRNSSGDGKGNNLNIQRFEKMLQENLPETYKILL